MADFTGTSGDDTFTGTDDDDFFDSGAGGDDKFYGGKGDDIFGFTSAFDLTAADQLDGGKGKDSVVIGGPMTGQLSLFFTPDLIKNVETLLLSTTIGNEFDMTLDDGNVAAGRALTIKLFGTADGTMRIDGSHELDGSLKVFAGNGDDLLIGGAQGDTLSSTGGDDLLRGRGGADVLDGGKGDDFIDGGADGDSITPGKGGDVLLYNFISDSTSVGFDIVQGFNFGGADLFLVAGTVTGTDPLIASGALNEGTFDSDLAAAANASALLANHAVLFQVTDGDFAGDIFMIVDANGIAGYQADADYVMQLVDSANLESFDTADFL